MGNDRRLGWAAPAASGLLAGLVAGLSLPPLGWPLLLWPALAVLCSAPATTAHASNSNSSTMQVLVYIPTYTGGVARVVFSSLTSVTKFLGRGNSDSPLCTTVGRSTYGTIAP